MGDALIESMPSINWDEIFSGDLMSDFRTEMSAPEIGQEQTDDFFKACLPWLRDETMVSGDLSGGFASLFNESGSHLAAMKTAPVDMSGGFASLFPESGSHLAAVKVESSLPEPTPTPTLAHRPPPIGVPQLGFQHDLSMLPETRCCREETAIGSTVSSSELGGSPLPTQSSEGASFSHGNGQCSRQGSVMGGAACGDTHGCVRGEAQSQTLGCNPDWGRTSYDLGGPNPAECFHQAWSRGDTTYTATNELLQPPLALARSGMSSSYFQQLSLSRNGAGQGSFKSTQTAAPLQQQQQQQHDQRSNSDLLSADDMLAGRVANLGVTSDKSRGKKTPSVRIKKGGAVASPRAKKDSPRGSPTTKSDVSGISPKSSSGRCEKPLDTTRRKNSEIARLEAELQSKLLLTETLAADNEGLQRRERLLKALLASEERTILCQHVEGMTPHLNSLLQSFRSSVNRLHTGQLIASMPKSFNDFSTKEFMCTWQTFVAEVSDILLGSSLETLDTQRITEVFDRITNWCMALAVHKTKLMMEVTNLDMQTGEVRVPEHDFWAGVVAKLELTDEQVRDFRAVWALHRDVFQGLSDQQMSRMHQLSILVDRDMETKFGPGASFASTGPDGRSAPAGVGRWSVASSCRLEPMNLATTLNEQEACIQCFLSGYRRFSMLHSMLTFLVLGLLTPWQCCVTVFSSFPSFPNLKMMLAAVCREPAPENQDGAGPQ